MAHFYGTINGKAKTEGSRLGTKKSGLSTTAASWEGAVQVSLWYDEEKQVDMVEVRLTPWHGAGTHKLLYSGPVRG